MFIVLEGGVDLQFRECRLITLNEMFKENNSSITVEKTFLSIGGIKASIYIMTERGVQYIVPSGCAEINIEVVCEALNINYQKVEIENFIERYLRDEDYRNDNVFILPCSSTILNVRKVEHLDKMMIGQSELMIDYVDVVESKVHLKFNILEGKKYWLDLDILKMLSNVKVWATNENINIIHINKLDIKKSQEMNKLLQKDNFKLLEECVFSYKKNTMVQYEDGITNIEGIGVYDIIVEHFDRLLTKLQLEKDIARKMKLLKYAKFQLRYFHMFTIAGSDGYYRNEFASTIGYVLSCENLSCVEQLKDDWLKVAKMWRQFGRELGVLLSDEKEILSALEFLINSIKKITNFEVNMIEKLEECLLEVTQS